LKNDDLNGVRLMENKAAFLDMALATEENNKAGLESPA
jgi:hypothetical protein